MTINKKARIGGGSCASICGEVFEMKDDMKAQKNLPCVKEAIDRTIVTNNKTKITFSLFI